MNIHHHPYVLSSKVQGAQAREGSLLRVEHQGVYGYVDLHPHPELGDESLVALLKKLKNGSQSPLLMRALALADVDAEFRKLKRSAFSQRLLPQTHRLFRTVPSLSEAEAAHREGFTHLKIKMGNALENLVAQAEVLEALVKKFDFILRLDFNAQLAPEVFSSWWSSLSEMLKARIDFVEDPCMGVLSLKGPWADDWHEQPGACIKIVKPAREAYVFNAKYQRVVFTHSLDHPLGQVAALWAACEFYGLNPKMQEVCGLAASDDDTGAFAEAWHCPGPQMRAPEGTGFGFDEILKRLEWHNL